MKRIEVATEYLVNSTPSPDGRKIAYSKVVPDTNEILCIYDLHTDEEHEIVNTGKGSVAWIYWSADGSELLYSKFIKRRHRQVYIASIKTGRAELVYSHPKEVAAPLGWTPDGKRILLLRYDSNRVNRIGTLNLRDRSYHDISTQYPDSIYADIWLPRLSPDGKYYISALRNRRAVGIKIFALDGKVSTTLADSLWTITSPVWSPDGKYIIMLNRLEETAELLLLKFDSGKIIGSPKLLKSGLGSRNKILGMTSNGKLFLGQRSSRTQVLTFDIDTTTLKSVSPPYPVGKKIGSMTSRRGLRRLRPSFTVLAGWRLNRNSDLR